MMDVIRPKKLLKPAVVEEIPFAAPVPIFPLPTSTAPNALNLQCDWIESDWPTNTVFENRLNFASWHCR